MNDIPNTSGAKLTARAIQARAVKLLSPVSTTDDSRRQELVLNVILLISIPFLTFADILIGRNTLRMGSHYHGVPFWISTGVVAVFVLLFIASKRGHHRIASYVLIAIYTGCTFYSGWHWGASLPATLLAVALVSVISSLLIGSRFGFIMSAALIAALSVLGIHEVKSLGTLPWKYQVVNVHDILIYSAIILFISALSWLSNREIEKSLRRARTSEKSLALERDSLEIKVIERTEALRAAQEQRVAELSRTAEFGKISQGLFHDLMTPLTSVALHMETLRETNIPEIHNSRAYLEKALRASERMGAFMHNIRRSIESHSPFDTDSVEKNKIIDLNHELSAAIDLLGYKARHSCVNIHSNIPQKVMYTGNPLHFLQIFLNLLSNGIDALEKTTGNKKITVTILSIENEKHEPLIKITVADNGAGIPKENRDTIFNDFYSTKSTGQGLGIGLSTVRKIITDKLGGSITVGSSADGGAEFTIFFPKH